MILFTIFCCSWIHPFSMNLRFPTPMGWTGHIYFYGIPKESYLNSPRAIKVTTNLETMDMFIELPMRTIIGFLRRWGSFMSTKRDDL